MPYVSPQDAKEVPILKFRWMPLMTDHTAACLAARSTGLGERCMTMAAAQLGSVSRMAQSRNSPPGGCASAAAPPAGPTVEIPAVAPAPAAIEPAGRAARAPGAAP